MFCCRISREHVITFTGSETMPRLQLCSVASKDHWCRRKRYLGLRWAWKLQSEKRVKQIEVLTPHKMRKHLKYSMALGSSKLVFLMFFITSRECKVNELHVSESSFSGNRYLQS